MSGNRDATKRLFFAVWPDEALSRDLARISGWSTKRSGGRRVPTENLHLTLVFLGDVFPEQSELLSELTGAITVSMIRLTFDQIEFWEKPRILCLASSHTDQGADLVDIVGRLRSLARSLGLKVENRPYRPHVTLVRKVRHLHQPPSIEPVTWLVNGICLVESVPVKGRYRYRIVQQW